MEAQDDGGDLNKKQGKDLLQTNYYNVIKGTGNMLQAITFDFWDTLFRLENSPEIDAVRIRDIGDVLAGHDLMFTPEQIRRGLHRCWKVASYNQRAFGFDIAPRGQIKILFEHLGLPENPAIVDEVYQAYTTVLRRLPPEPVEGIVEALDYLKDKFLLAIICNTGATPGIILRELLDRKGMLGYFKTTVFSDEVSWAKPNIAIFKHTLTLLGTNDRETVHIGDDALTDVIGSRKAGMKSVWYAPRADWPVPECSWHIRKMNELRSIF